MRQKLLLGIAISALTVGGAFAQAPTAPAANGQTKPPAAAPAKPDTKAPAVKPDTSEMKSDKSATTPAEPSAANKKAPAATSTTTAANTATDTETPKIIASQKPDQLLASKFTGTDVIGSNGKKIGDVSDILFTKDGTIKAYVVSFGGFLGIGSKEVAIAPNAFEVVPGKDGGSKKLKLGMSQKALKSAQKFAAYNPPAPAKPASTVGSGTMGGGATHAPSSGKPM